MPHSLSLDFGWQFHLGDRPDALPEFENFDWQPVDLPHDWSITLERQADAPCRGDGGYFPTGIGWYRREIEVSTAARVWLEFEGVAGVTQVYLNGQLLGQHAYAFTPFRLEIASFLRFDQPNTLVLRVDHCAQPDCRWYAGSGLYRSVWLETAPAIHFVPDGAFISTLQASSKAATVRIEAAICNGALEAQDLTLEIEVRDPSGGVAASKRLQKRVEAGAVWLATTEIEVAAPQLWSPETTALYQAKLRLLEGEKIGDTTEITSGIRTIAVSAARGFELNGQVVKMFGGNLHGDHGPLGSASFPRAEERKVEILKSAGFNAVRTAHNPPSPAFLDACDRLGMLVVDEVFDGWKAPKLPQDYSVHFDENWQTDLEATLLRDRNHPCVVMWSIGNEVFERGKPSGAQICAAIAARVREIDTSRPVTLGLNNLGANGEWEQLDPMFAPLDVAGFNYEIARYTAEHVRLPSRVMVGSESYPNQAFESWAATHDLPCVIGDFVWTAWDYLGEAGLGRVFAAEESAELPWVAPQWPFHGAPCGDIDLLGHRKPVSHARQIIWNRGETLFAAVQTPSPDGKPPQLLRWSLPPLQASWTWPGQENRELQVEIWSRHDAVRVYLNTRLLGETPTTRNERFQATFLVPYEPGELRVVGLQNGREVETFTLSTAGEAARLQLAADRATFAANGQDLLFVSVEITDSNGVLRSDANFPVQFSVRGPAVIAGIGSGDLSSFEPYNCNPRRSFEGRALVVLRSTREAGQIELRATAPGLESATITIETT